MCNARSQRLNIQFCQVPYLATQRVCTQMIYTHNDTRNKIFGFVISHLNFDQNAVNHSQKLKKFITVSSEVLQTTE